jgi:hypothetical protein
MRLEDQSRDHVIELSALGARQSCDHGAMKLILAGWFALVVVACAGDSPDEQTGEFGATCMTVSDTSTECDSGVCTDTFDQIGHPVCSQKCTVGDDSTCPEGSGGKKCNMKGYCKP